MLLKTKKKSPKDKTHIFPKKEDSKYELLAIFWFFIMPVNYGFYSIDWV